jgi:hypothetical protein
MLILMGRLVIKYQGFLIELKIDLKNEHRFYPKYRLTKEFLRIFRIDEKIIIQRKIC